MVQQWGGVSPLLQQLFGAQSPVPQGTAWHQGAFQEKVVRFKMSALWFGGRNTQLFLRSIPGLRAPSAPAQGSQRWCSLSTNTQKNVQAHSGLLSAAVQCLAQHTPVLLSPCLCSIPRLGWGHPRAVTGTACTGCAAQLLFQ